MNKIRLIKILILASIALVLIGCGEFSDEKDFRNYLRDMHPYSHLEKNQLNRWSYIVNDTIKNEKWIYLGSVQKSNVRRHLLNCNY